MCRYLGNGLRLDNSQDWEKETGLPAAALPNQARDFLFVSFLVDNDNDNDNSLFSTTFGLVDSKEA